MTSLSCRLADPPLVCASVRGPPSNPKFSNRQTTRLDDRQPTPNCRRTSRQPCVGSGYPSLAAVASPSVLHPLPAGAPPPPPLGGHHSDRDTSLSSTAAMSLVNLAHVCSHLQNASKARLGLTSIPVSKLHVNLMLGLQREGFLSSVTLGGPTPPKPFQLQAQQSPEEFAKLARRLKTQPWDAYPPPEPTDVTPLQSALISTSASAPVFENGVVDSEANQEEKNPPSKAPLGSESVYTVTVPQNPAKRRLWLGLKYWNNEPVLKHMKLISKPTRRIWLTSEDLGKITRTRESSYVKGLTHPGECMFVTTDRGILEARDCVERRLGGMVLCRVW